MSANQVSKRPRSSSGNGHEVSVRQRTRPVPAARGPPYIGRTQPSSTADHEGTRSKKTATMTAWTVSPGAMFSREKPSTGAPVWSGGRTPVPTATPPDLIDLCRRQRRPHHQPLHERQLQPPQGSGQPGPAHLLRRLRPVAGVRVHPGWAQQAHLVVEPQRLAAQPGQAHRHGVIGETSERSGTVDHAGADPRPHNQPARADVRRRAGWTGISSAMRANSDGIDHGAPQENHCPQLRRAPHFIYMTAAALVHRKAGDAVRRVTSSWLASVVDMRFSSTAWWPAPFPMKPRMTPRDADHQGHHGGAGPDHVKSRASSSAARCAVTNYSSSPVIHEPH
jgi:hypothetical protein